MLGVIEDNRVLNNPARRLRIKRRPIPDEVFLDYAQVDGLALASRYPDLIGFLASSGLRWGEATALRCGTSIVSAAELTSGKLWRTSTARITWGR